MNGVLLNVGLVILMLSYLACFFGGFGAGALTVCRRRRGP